jgi:hypothetical protein
MEKVHTFTTMGISIKGFGLMTANREKELCKWKRETHTQANGKIVRSMAEGCINLAMMITTRVNL